jgi:hypothetical protein
MEKRRRKRVEWMGRIVKVVWNVLFLKCSFAENE